MAYSVPYKSVLRRYKASCLTCYAICNLCAVRCILKLRHRSGRHTQVFTLAATPKRAIVRSYSGIRSTKPNRKISTESKRLRPEQQIKDKKMNVGRGGGRAYFKISPVNFPSNFFFHSFNPYAQKGIRLQSKYLNWMLHLAISYRTRIMASSPPKQKHCPSVHLIILQCLFRLSQP